MLVVLNLFIGYMIIASAVVLFWRGTWGLLDVLVFPFEPDDNSTCLMKKQGGRGDREAKMHAPLLKSALVCYLVGFTISGICTITSYLASSYGVDVKRWPNRLSIPVSYLWTYVQGVGAVACWRGVWLMWDLLPVSPALQAVSGHVAGIVITVALVSFKSVLAPPAVISCDFDLDLAMPKWFVLRDRKEDM